MSDFDINMFYGRAFDQCVACSKKVLEEYTNHKEEFMLSVMNDPQYIHKVTGMDVVLKEMEENMEGIMHIVEDDEDGIIIL